MLSGKLEVQPSTSQTVKIGNFTLTQRDWTGGEVTYEAMGVSRFTKRELEGALRRKGFAINDGENGFVASKYGVDLEVYPVNDRPDGNFISVRQITPATYTYGEATTIVRMLLTEVLSAIDPKTRMALERTGN